MSDSPKTMDFTLAIRSSHGGLMLSTAESIGPQQKLSIDLRGLVAQLGGDPNGAYEQGSVALYFMGTIMPIVGQISIRNPQLRLSHESEMVENDPGRSDVPPVLNGEWWGLGEGVEAEVMVSNTSDSPQMAQVYLDFGGKRHPVPKTLTFLPYETKTLDITQLVESLGVDPAGAPEGGITIIQAGPTPALIANGKITDPATGFSSTIDFPLPQVERASALHAAGLPIGTPSKDSPFAGTGTYTPRVIVRNLLATPQSVTITVEYPAAPAASASATTSAGGSAENRSRSAAPGQKARMAYSRLPLPGDRDHHPEWGAGLGATTRSLNVVTLPVPGYSTIDYSLAPAMLQLPQPLPFCSIRIQYSGPPGSLEAEVSSVENTTRMVVDARVENEGNGWAGSGANPWHLDKNTESILFLTNESATTARIGFSITANGVHYYLSELKLQPHETRAINIRALRDAQIADFRKSTIPAGATDGSVNWIRIDNVPVMGRLMVITRNGTMDSSYDCCVSCCAASLFNLAVQQDGFDITIGGSQQCNAIGYYQDCNGNQTFPSVDAGWTSGDANVATVSAGDITGAGGGTTTVTATYTGWEYNCQDCPVCDSDPVTVSAESGVAVQVQAQISSTTLSGSTINRDVSPTQVTLTVRVFHQAFAASGSGSVTVEVGTYNATPSNNSVSYTPTSQVLTLSGPAGSSTTQFTVGGASMTGSVVIESSLANPSSDVVIEAPSPVTNAQASLNTSSQ